MSAKKDVVDPKDGEFDVTRCPECTSDEIYSFEDSDGGLCTKCKCIVTGIIRGGISKAEMRRRRGEIAVPEDAPEVKKPEKAPERIKSDLPRVVQDAIDARTGVNVAVKALERSIAPVAKAPEMIKAPSGPGFIKKFVTVIRDFQKEMKATAPKVEAPKVAAPVPLPVPPPVSVPAPIKRLENTAFKPPLPIPGERWAIGPCPMCRLKQKYTGTVRPKGYDSRNRYIWIYESSIGELSGCILCAKKL